jgi:hypothetical protein
LRAIEARVRRAAVARGCEAIARDRHRSVTDDA